eukprot:gene13652-4551_t
MSKRKALKNDETAMTRKFPKLEEDFSDRKEIWTFDERCRLVEALDSKFSTFNNLVAKHVGSKQIRDVKNYTKFYQLLETGVKYPEFLDSTPVDAWISLAEKTQKPDDKQAEECIPQIMTAAAREPETDSNASDPTMTPNYSNIYNYLALLLRGGKPPDLSPIDADVVLNLLNDLIERFANSYTMLQREFLHDAFSVLSGKNNGQASMENNTETFSTDPLDSSQNKQQSREFSSFNPFNVPAILLDFKKKKPIVLDFSTSWRTKLE